MIDLGKLLLCYYIYIKKMRKVLIFSLIVLLSEALLSQSLVTTKPARLQVAGTIIGVEDFIIESDKLKVTIEQKVMKGVLEISSLRSTDKIIQEMLERSEIEKIMFEILIPEGTFRYGNAMNKKVNCEGDILYGQKRNPFMIELDVSNKKSNNVNSFIVVGSADLEIDEHLGIDAAEVLDVLNNKFRFQFWLNLEQIKL
jgi:hypothetical protein